MMISRTYIIIAIIFIILLIAANAFSQSLAEPNYMEAASGITASGGVNTWQSLLASILFISWCVFKEVKDSRYHSKLEKDRTKTKTERDDKIKRLFNKSDSHDADLNSVKEKVALLEQTVKGIESLAYELKEMGKELKEIKLDMRELMTIQKSHLTRGNHA